MTRSHEAELNPDPDANTRFVLGNIAANGRLFVALIVAIDVALWLGTRNLTFSLSALAAIGGLGAAIQADRSEASHMRSILSSLSTSLPAGALLATFLKVLF